MSRLRVVACVHLVCAEQAVALLTSDGERPAPTDHPTGELLSPADDRSLRAYDGCERRRPNVACGSPQNS